MKLIGSQTSPFTRVIRVVLAELKIPFEFEITPPFAKLTDVDDLKIAAFNPLGKVPILIDGDQAVIDSRIIVAYLMKNYGNGSSEFRAPFPTDTNEENNVSVILGMLDAGILRFVMQVQHPEIAKDKGFMKRCEDKIKNSLGWLESREDLGKSFGVAEVVLICAIEWFEKRNIYQWRGFSHVTEVHSKYEARPSFLATRIPDAV